MDGNDVLSIGPWGQTKRTVGLCVHICISGLWRHDGVSMKEPSRQLVTSMAMMYLYSTTGPLMQMCIFSQAAFLMQQQRRQQQQQQQQQQQGC
eukprot:260637-Amphidinium_carterae.2